MPAPGSGGAHVPTLYELYLFRSAAAGARFVSALIGAAYLALAPIVRRRWPHVIIGWSRVLSGKTVNALVGRDLLVGFAAGLLIESCAHLASLLYHPSYPGPATLSLVFPVMGLTSLRGALAVLSVGQFWVIGRSLVICLLYVASYVVMRRHWLAGGIIIVIVAILNLLYGGTPLGTFWVTLYWTALVVLLIRFGLLAVMAAQYAGGTLDAFPVTTDLTQGYASTGLIAVVVILALTVWAFRTSLGGQALFKQA